MSASDTPRTDALRKQHESYMRSGPILATDPDMFAEYSKLEHALTAANAKLAAAEKDAARYRWIAENYDAFVAIQKAGHIGVEIEAAIDDAIAQEGKP